MGQLLKHQGQVSGRMPLPVDVMDSSSTASTFSAGTVQLYYYNSGTRTSDAGQAAGTVVDFAFSHRNIYDSLGVQVACKDNTSLVFTCAALTTEIDPTTNIKLANAMESHDYGTPAEKAAAIGALLTSGQYVIDYRQGMGWAKKATTASTMTSTSYKISTVASGSSTTDLGKVEDSAHTSGDVGVMMLAVRNDAGTVLAGTDGDYIPLTTDSNGNLRVQSSGSGSAGGGNNTYSTEQGDFTATVTNATNNIVLSVDSIGGSAITAANFANGILKVHDISVSTTKSITLDEPIWTASTKTLNTTNCTGAFTFATGDVVSLTLTGPDKMRDSATDATRTSPIRDLSDQYVGETLAALSNIAANTTGYLYFGMDGYKTFALQCATSDATPTDTITLTVEATYQDDGTADSSCDYDDVTNDWFGVASVVDTDVIFDKDTPTTAKYVRLKYVTSNTGGSDADVTVYLKRKW